MKTHYYGMKITLDLEIGGSKEIAFTITLKTFFGIFHRLQRSF